MKKQVIKINENQLKYIVAEAAKRILKEGTTNMKHIEMFDYLIEMCGAEQVLRCIFDWLDSSRIEQWLEWFKEDGYFDGSQFEYEEDEEELNENYGDTTKTIRLGFDGPIYGCTLEGEWFAYDPSKMNSIPCQSEEEARMKSEEMKKRMDAEEFKSRKDFDLMNSMD